MPRLLIHEIALYSGLAVNTGQSRILHMYKDIIPKKMKPSSHFSLGRLSKFAKIYLFLAMVSSLFGCQPLDTVPTSTTPLVEVQILTPSLLTETPEPECRDISDIELFVELLSENSISLRITGLVPNEMVQAIFSSQIKGQERKKTVSGPADENGVFEYSIGLRGQNIDYEFKDWQIRIVHSRGATCTEVSLP